jgi:hypothetical protein
MFSTAYEHKAADKRHVALDDLAANQRVTKPGLRLQPLSKSYVVGKDIV